MSSCLGNTSTRESAVAESRDVVVVGGGVIGCTVARMLSARGASVVVLEREVPGRAATWAAGGMLSPLGEAGETAAFFRLATESLDRYPQFVSELAAQSGIDVEYRPAGKLHVSLGDDGAILRDLYERGRGFGVQLMTGDEARSLEPALGPAVDEALFVGRDHRVNSRLLGVAVWKAAESTGVEVRCDAHVAAIELDDASRFAAVRLTDGSRVTGESVVIAAGAWSGSIQGLPSELPVVPVRGEMMAVQTGNGPHDAHFQRVIHAPGCYLIPREDHRLVVGATSAHVGFEAGPTPAGIAALASAAAAVAPVCSSRPLAETWSGFRPGTPDDLPILGADPLASGVYYSTGHYRNGLLLAPITAEIMAACVLGGTPPVPIGAFGIDRFSSLPGRSDTG